MALFMWLVFWNLETWIMQLQTTMYYSTTITLWIFIIQYTTSVGLIFNCTSLSKPIWAVSFFVAPPCDPVWYPQHRVNRRIDDLWWIHVKIWVNYHNLNMTSDVLYNQVIVVVGTLGNLNYANTVDHSSLRDDLCIFAYVHIYIYAYIDIQNIWWWCSWWFIISWTKALKKGLARANHHVKACDESVCVLWKFTSSTMINYKSIIFPPTDIAISIQAPKWFCWFAVWGDQVPTVPASWLSEKDPGSIWKVMWHHLSEGLKFSQTHWSGEMFKSAENKTETE